MANIKGKIPDGKYASSFSSCGNTRKTHDRPSQNINPNSKKE